MEAITNNKANVEAFLLLFKHEVCVRCILRFFKIDVLDMYRDRAQLLKLVGVISDTTHHQPHLLTLYDVTQLKLKSQQPYCRLCLGLLQSCDSATHIKQISTKILSSQFEFQKFKFMIKVPNSTMLRFSHMVEYVRVNVGGQLEARLVAGWKDNHIEIKTVLKWVLAPLVAGELNAQSTLDQNCLQVNLVFQNQEDQNQTFNRFHALLRNIAVEKLNKKVEKIQKRIKYDKLDNLQKKVDNIEPSMANLTKIFNIDSDFAFRTIYNSEFCAPVKNCCQIKIEARCNSIFLFGYYVKYSRYLSQTPWVVDGKKLADSSIQEELERALLKHFYPEKLWSSNLAKFHSGGREDIDVRMLSTGRPFALEFCSPRFNRIESNPNGIELITEQINKSQFLKVNRLQFTTDRCLEVLKKSEQQKVKAYSCFVHFQKPYTDQDVKKLNSLIDLNLNQKTPLRVLHRRTIMVRIKTIHKMAALPIDSRNMILNVLASAGTYIKEFVHGDLGRTLPNIGSLINNAADIFQLDVLKIYEKMDQSVVDDFMSIAQKF